MSVQLLPMTAELDWQTRTNYPSSRIERMTTESEARSKEKSSRHILKGAVEIVKGRLYYIALKSKPADDLYTTTRRSGEDGTKRKKPIHFFDIDYELVYWNFFLDFGPLNLGQLFRFCSMLNEKLNTMKNHVICFYSSTAPAKRTNAIYLITAWQVLYLGRTPENAFRGFVPPGTPAAENSSETMSISGTSEKTATLKISNASAPPASKKATITTSPLPPFHDASPCACTYDLTIIDCLKGLVKARMHGFFDFENFDINEYEHFEQVENGDLNWIIKDKILAFAGPSYERHVSPEGYCTLAPADYIPYFLQKNVGLVVRLNKKAYNEQDFLDAGIDHLEQFYTDGSCPPMKILNRVLEAFENVGPGKAFAVHCKAGLGRTGTCIGAYLMKHYRFTAAEAIGWMRICRPGMVIGPQQQFLQEIEQRMWQLGSVIRPSLALLDAGDENNNNNEAKKQNTKQKVTTSQEHHIPDRVPSTTNDAVMGRAGQAEGLLAARAGRGGTTTGATDTAAFVTPEKANIIQQEECTPGPPAQTTMTTKMEKTASLVTPDAPASRRNMVDLNHS